MARTGRLVGAPLGDPSRELVRVRELVGQSRSPGERGVAVGLDYLERVEAARDRPAAVEGVDRIGDAPQLCRLPEALGRRDRPVDEARHEPPLRLDEVDDLGADPELVGGPRRGELDGAIDPEQVRVAPRDT